MLSPGLQPGGLAPARAPPAHAAGPVLLDRGSSMLVELDTDTPLRVLPATGRLAPQHVLLSVVALLLLGSRVRRSRAFAD